MLGYSESEWLGKDTKIIFTPEERDEGVAEQEMNEAAARGEAVNDRWHVSKDGNLRWINGVMTGLRDQDGKLRGFAKIMRDNTELREAQEALREANEMLEERVRERTVELEAVNNELVDFTYSASHDLRTTLRGIDGFSQLVLEEYDEVLDEKGRGYLSKIREGAARIGELLDDLLALSHVTRTSFERQPVDLSRCARWIADNLRDKHGQRKVQVRIQEGLIGEGDPESLSIVLEHLLENAWKFTGDQECALIEFGVKSARDEEIYFVRDNGVGFDMKYADKLFKTFRSLHSTRRVRRNRRRTSYRQAHHRSAPGGGMGRRRAKQRSNLLLHAGE